MHPIPSRRQFLTAAALGGLGAVAAQQTAAAANATNDDPPGSNTSFDCVYNVTFEANLTANVLATLPLGYEYMSGLGMRSFLSTVNRRFVQVDGNVHWQELDAVSREHRIALVDLQMGDMFDRMVSGRCSPSPFSVYSAGHSLFSYAIDRYCFIPHFLAPHVRKERRIGVVLFDLRGSTLGSPRYADTYDADGVRVAQVYPEAYSQWNAQTPDYERRVVFVGLGSNSDADTLEVVLARLGTPQLPKDSVARSVRVGDQALLRDVFAEAFEG